MDSLQQILLQSINSPRTGVCLFVTSIIQAEEHINEVQHLEQSSGLLLTLLKLFTSVSSHPAGDVDNLDRGVMAHENHSAKTWIYSRPTKWRWTRHHFIFSVRTESYLQWVGGELVTETPKHLLVMRWRKFSLWVKLNFLQNSVPAREVNKRSTHVFHFTIHGLPDQTLRRCNRWRRVSLLLSDNSTTVAKGGGIVKAKIHVSFPCSLCEIKAFTHRGRDW